MKRALAEAYSYGFNCIIEYSVDDSGWNVYQYDRKIAGPFYTWIEAQEWVDEHEEYR